MLGGSRTMKDELLKAEHTALAMAHVATPESRKILETMATDLRARADAIPATPSIGMQPFLIGIAALFGIYFAMAWQLSQAPIPVIPKGAVVVQLVRPFYKEGNAVVASPDTSKQVDEFGDDPKNIDDRSSPLLIYEDGVPLGPAHGTFADIHNFGSGRYAHWKGQGIVFSSSDNTDPNTNNRRYFAVIP